MTGPIYTGRLTGPEGTLSNPSDTDDWRLILKRVDSTLHGYLAGTMAHSHMGTMKRTDDGWTCRLVGFLMGNAFDIVAVRDGDAWALTATVWIAPTWRVPMLDAEET
jgi:hypothetical protein